MHSIYIHSMVLYIYSCNIMKKGFSFKAERGALLPYCFFNSNSFFISSDETGVPPALQMPLHGAGDDGIVLHHKDSVHCAFPSPLCFHSGWSIASGLEKVKFWKCSFFEYLPAAKQHLSQIAYNVPKQFGGVQLLSSPSGNAVAVASSGIYATIVERLREAEA